MSKDPPATKSFGTRRTSQEDSVRDVRKKLTQQQLELMQDMKVANPKFTSSRVNQSQPRPSVRGIVANQSRNDTHELGYEK